jgi:hypothetical protein
VIVRINLRDNNSIVDLEVDFRTYRAKDGTTHTSLRIVAYKGEF